MQKVKNIHIFGASGSGSTTFARAIADRYGYHHIDTDDALWEKTDPPFTVKRDLPAVKNLIEMQMSENEKNVISGEFLGWGDFLKGKIDLLVYMHLPVEIRIERIKAREIKRFGARVLPGGDMHQAHLDFLAWVREYEHGDDTRRSVAMHQKWLKRVDIPILRVEEAASIETLLQKIEPYLTEEKSAENK